jgi:hypothetical protein
MTDPRPGGEQGTSPYSPPVACPACGDELLVTRLQCPNCRTEVSGTFAHPAHSGPDAGRTAPLNRLINLPEPFASLLELFIRVRGNVKDVERELGLSYPTVRARLDEAFKAAQPYLEPQPRPTPVSEGPSQSERAAILAALERGEISAGEATTRLSQPQRK